MAPISPTSAARGRSPHCRRSNARTCYFGPHIYGALDDYRSFSEKMIIDRILRDNDDLRGEQLLGFGDGFVEIEEVKGATWPWRSPATRRSEPASTPGSATDSFAPGPMWLSRGYARQRSFFAGCSRGKSDALPARIPWSDLIRRNRKVQTQRSRQTCAAADQSPSSTCYYCVVTRSDWMPVRSEHLKGPRCHGSPEASPLFASRLRFCNGDFVGHRHDLSRFPFGEGKGDRHSATTHVRRGSHGAVTGVHSSAAKPVTGLGPLLESHLDRQRCRAAILGRELNLRRRPRFEGMNHVGKGPIAKPGRSKEHHEVHALARGPLARGVHQLHR